jgi:CBS domain-containing protein
MADTSPDVAARLAGTAGSILDDKGHTVFSIDEDASVYDAVAKMDSCRVGALCVTQADTLVGVVSERDYTRKVILQGRASRDTRVAEIMSAPPVCVEPSTPLAECMRIVTERRVRHLPVVESGRLVGVVSIGDLVRRIIAQQEQIIVQLDTMITGPYPG